MTFCNNKPTNNVIDCSLFGIMTLSQLDLIMP